jgi:hypothetical protein
VALGSAVPGGSPDPVGGATDLKVVFDARLEAADPRERRIAARAFEACVPAFMPGPTQTPSPEPMIRALPADHRAEREAAYWALFARCQGFAGAGRASLVRWQERLRADSEAQDPGVRAQEDLLAGRYGQMDAMVAQALDPRDPAAVASLSGLATKLGAIRDPDAADVGLAQRAHAVDAALPLVACDLGLDCSVNSLQSLEICAAQGACAGDYASRLANTAGPFRDDASSVQKERLRLLGLVRSGQPLTAADLLP